MFFLLPGSSTFDLNQPVNVLPTAVASDSSSSQSGRAFSSIGGGGYFDQRDSWSLWRARGVGRPYFSHNATHSRVLASRGQTSYLHCMVGNLGDRQVKLMCKFKDELLQRSYNMLFMVQNLGLREINKPNETGFLRSCHSTK